MGTSDKIRPGKIIVCVTGGGTAKRPIRRALIHVHCAADPESNQPEGPALHWAWTGEDGCCVIDSVASGMIYCDSFNTLPSRPVPVPADCAPPLCFEDPIDIAYDAMISDGCELKKCSRGTVGATMHLIADTGNCGADRISEFRWSLSKAGTLRPVDDKNKEMLLTPQEAGLFRIVMTAVGHPPTQNPARGAGDDEGGPEMFIENQVTVGEAPVHAISCNIGVALRRSQTDPTDSQALWVAIRNRTKAISFSGSGYKDFIDRVLCLQDTVLPDKASVTLLNRQMEELGDHVYGTRAYDLLKTATEVFLLLECGVAIKRHGVADRNTDRPLFNENEEAGRLGQAMSPAEVNATLTHYLGQDRLPYINRVVKAAFPGDVVGGVHCEGVLTSRVNEPCLLELIWNYWHEEGLLVQSLNAVSQRFQNVRAPGERDPLHISRSIRCVRSTTSCGATSRTSATDFRSGAAPWSTSTSMV